MHAASVTPPQTAALADFSAEISALHLSPLWERKVKLEPGSACVPALWPYARMRPLLERAAGLISKKQADRRVLVMENPSLRGSSFISNSLFAGLQIILPGEVAPSHRHSPSALRFVVEGSGAYTAVDGERIPMHPGDFVVTPGWAWHDHGNLGDAPVVWMDGLDTPFASLFGAHFRENHPADSQPMTRPHGSTLHLHGANMLPLAYAPGQGPDAASPLLVYPFDRVSAVLRGLARDCPQSIDPAQGYKLRYANPATGGYPFATMAAFMQLLPRGYHGGSYRSTENAVFNVAQGSCRVRLASGVQQLHAHDVLVVPGWESYSLQADEDCLLFSFSDRAAQQALGFWREESPGGA